MEVDSRSRSGLEPVAPPRPSMVIKSGSAYMQCSRSCSICPAAILIPIGRPFERSRSIVTIAFKSSLEQISEKRLGLWISSPGFFPRSAAISAVTFSPGRCPPIPGFVPCPILISIASALRRLSSVTLYLFGIYSKMYLYAAAFSSGRMPPSPLHMAVFAMALPFERAIFASLERAPKDI